MAEVVTDWLIALTSGVIWRFLLDKLWKVLSSERTHCTPQFLGEHHVQVLPEGQRDTTSYWRWTIFWPGVSDTVLMQSNLLFVTERETVHFQYREPPTHRMMVTSVFTKTAGPSGNSPLGRLRRAPSILRN